MLAVGDVIERGPKRHGGFDKELSRQTDEEIVERVYTALAASGYLSLRNLQVYCDHSRVILQGRLPTFFLKQLAQSIIQRVEGVRDIDNDVRVQSFQIGSR